MFKKGRTYRFSPLNRQGGRPGQKDDMRKAARYEYLSRERGSGVDMLLFRSVAGRWRESFTPAQIGDYEVREAGR
jgi:hypothetical protein